MAIMSKKGPAASNLWTGCEDRDQVMLESLSRGASAGRGLGRKPWLSSQESILRLSRCLKPWDVPQSLLVLRKRPTCLLLRSDIAAGGLDGSGLSHTPGSNMGEHPGWFRADARRRGKRQSFAPNFPCLKKPHRPPNDVTCVKSPRYKS